MIAALSWGPEGVREARTRGDVVVVVDTLRFSSTATTAVANGFEIFPVSDPSRAESLAAETGMPISGRTGKARYSNSPLDYVNPRHVEELILISPNGAACMEAAGEADKVFVGCFLNARTIGRVMRNLCARAGGNLTVVAAGEVAEDQYVDLRTRRFAIEDYLACGLILCELKLAPTAEATLCMRAYEASKMDFADLVKKSESGRWLIERGLEADISHCVQRSIYEIVPVLRDGRMVAYQEPRYGEPR